ncbi:MAG: class I SAM-dependent methyltransferase [Actinomycetia bacterium]|nr:class I SAM-dependent methyltransferase [Actinomycetes bacterium]MCP4963252.1 class I SAM-dependent methyltransferase [Actinomycetes bacterium]
MEPVVPNHHAHHPGFRGRAGFAAAKRFLEVGPDASVGCDLTDVGPGDHVIDIGSGPGVAAREAVRRGATALAVDPASVMIRVGRARNDHPDITWRQGTAEAVPSEDASATVVWSMATVHHWQNIDEGLAEVRRILKPGGRFLATERHLRGDGTDATDHGWTEGQAGSFMASCREHGFENVTLDYGEASRGKLLCVLANQP